MYRKIRHNIGQLDQLLAEEGELVITRLGQPIARILPMPTYRQFLRQNMHVQMLRLKIPSADPTHTCPIPLD